MKILIATESYYPNISGVAVFAHNLAKKMQKRGHRVFVFAPSPKFREYQEIFDGVKIFRLASKINKFRQGYYISRFPFKKIAALMEKIQPDVVHLQDPALIALATMLKARKMKVPIVVTNHFSLEYITSYMPNWKIIHPLILFLLNKYLHWFYQQCQYLTCPTKTVAKRFQNFYRYPKIVVISNGVDTSHFMPSYGDLSYLKKQLKIPAKLPVVLYIGRLDIDKQIDILIKAIPDVLKKIQIHFLIIGSGTQKQRLKILAKNLNIYHHLTFLDFIPHSDPLLVKIYQIGSVFVNPCPCETQSIVALEAAATGLPIIAADQGALPEIVRNGVNGFLFKTGDSQELAQKIIKIFRNRKLSEQMRKANLELVLTHLIDTTFDRFEHLYQELVI